jgi:hypothetical protein
MSQKGERTMRKLISLTLIYVISMIAANFVSAGDSSVSTFFVINSPSAASRGTDSILTFDSLGNSAVFFGAEHDFSGLFDIACDPTEPQHIFVSHILSSVELLEFDASASIVNIIPFGTFDFTALAFDHAGNFYVAKNETIFKNGVSFASLPFTGIGRLAADSRGNLYLTDPFVLSRLFRIDPLGNVILFADATKGLSGPYGLAVDSMDNIFVANSIPSGPASILKFDQSGTATLFATGISFQPVIRSMTFDRDDNLYATLQNDNKILKFDKAGNSSVFADASNGLNFPFAITAGTCPVRRIIPFAAFTAQVEITLGPRTGSDAFQERATFTLGPATNGINPPTEAVSLQIGTFSTIIPAGSFQAGPHGQFTFDGVINGVTLEVRIAPQGGNSFIFQAEGTNADLSGTTNPVTVTLTIGDDSGTTTVTAEIQ